MRRLLLAGLAAFWAAFLLVASADATGTGIFPNNWIFPGGPGYAATALDNGNVISASGTSAGLTVTLPSTTSIAAGWSIGILAPTPALPLTLVLNGVSGGQIVPGNGVAITTGFTAPLNQLRFFQYDGQGHFIEIQGTAAGSIVYHYPSNAAVKAQLVFPGSKFIRDGVIYAGDAPDATYVVQSGACPLNSGNGDGGSQLPTGASPASCAYLVPPAGGIVDAKEWGSTGYGWVSATCQATAGSNQIRLSTAAPFVNGWIMDCIGAGPIYAAGTPPRPTVTVIGTPGSATVCADIRFVGVNMSVSAKSPEQCVFNAPNQMGDVVALRAAAKGVQVAWPQQGTAVLGVIVDIGFGSGAETFAARAGVVYNAWNFYGDTTNCTSVATGLPCTSRQNQPPWVPAPSSSSQSQFLQGTISAGGGTSLVTLASAAQTTVSGMPAWIDDSAAEIAAAAARDASGGNIGEITHGPGTYIITQGIQVAGNGGLIGCGLGCATIQPEGAFTALTLTDPNCQTKQIASPPQQCFAPHANGFTIEALGDIGMAILANGVQYGYAHDINVDQPFNWFEETNTSGFRVDAPWNATGTIDGDWGTYLYGPPGPGGISGPTNLTVAATLLNGINGAPCENCTQFYMSGVVNSTQGDIVFIYRAPREFIQDMVANPNGPTPSFNHFRRLACNFGWYACVTLSDANETTFDDPYIQCTPGGNSDCVDLSASTTQTYFSLGQVFGSRIGNNPTQGADLGGINCQGCFGFHLNGTDVWSNTGPAIISSGPGTTIYGGGDYAYISEVSHPSESIGVQLLPAGGHDFLGNPELGACGAVVHGNWYGQIADVQDTTGCPASNDIADRQRGAVDTEATNLSTGSKLLAATYPNLYNQGVQAVTYLSGPTGTAQLQFDTAANIAAAIGNTPGRSTLILFKNMAPNPSVTINFTAATGDSGNITITQPNPIPGTAFELCNFVVGNSSHLAVACSR